MHVFVLGETALDEQVRHAWESGCETIVAAGGDGTISAVADSILRLGLSARLGILPAGTLNHFAKDLGIPVDAAEALRVIDEGHTALVDVARVNDRHFINNSSIGVYPYLLRLREDFERRGMHKWVAFARALVSLGTKRFRFSVGFGNGQTSRQKNASSIFVGNNKYALSGADIGSRKRLDEGALFVAITSEMHGLALARLLYKAFRGKALEDPALDTIGLSECIVESKRPLFVAYDGELAQMQPPVRYSIAPLSLRVIVPRV